MPGSFSFDGTDMATKGLYLLNPLPEELLTPGRDSFVNILGKPGGYVFPQETGARRWNLNCYCTGSSHSDLLAKLQDIKAILSHTKGLKQLIFDTQTGRYYMAKISGTVSAQRSAVDADVMVDFIVPSPFACSTTETDTTENISADPHNYNLTVGGDAEAVPVYTLTAKAAGVDLTVKLKNNTRNEEITWQGSLALDDILVIDCDKWQVKKNGAVDMSNVSGQWPMLNGGVSNSMTVSGFPLAATPPPYSTIRNVFRARYL